MSILAQPRADELPQTIVSSVAVMATQPVPPDGFEDNEEQRRTSLRGKWSRINGGLAREGLWTVVVRVFGILTAIAVDVVISHVLSPADAGAYFLLTSILSFSAMLAGFGLAVAMTRFVSEGLGRRDVKGTRRSIRIGWQVASISIPLTAIGSLLAVYFGGERLFHLSGAKQLAPWLAACVVGLPVLQIVANLFRSLHQSGMATLLTGQGGGPISNILFLAALALCALVVVPNVVYATAINACVLVTIAPLSLLLLRRQAHKQLNSKGSSSEINEPLTWSVLLATCLPLTTSQVLSYCTGFGDLWVAGGVVPHDQLALYAAARRLMLLVGMPLQLVNLVLVASIAELRAQGKLFELERMLRACASIAAVPALLALLMLILFPGRIAQTVFGPYYAQAGPVVVILCLGQIILVSAGSAELTLMMTGQQNAALGVNLLTTTVLAAFGVPVARRFGIVGLAFLNSLIIAVQVSLFTICAKKRTGVWTTIDPTLGLGWWRRNASPHGRSTSHT